MDIKLIDNVNRRKDKTEDVFVTGEANVKVSDLKRMIMNKLQIKLNENRIGLFLLESDDKKTLLSNPNKKLSDYPITDKSTIIVRDLGPQIGWRFTYIFEYLGPFFFIILFFLRLGPHNANKTQILGFIMSTFHFGKRILESIYIHTFSNNTMPLKNLFINCTYYWLIYGVICGYSLFNESYKEPEYNTFIHYFMVALFFSAEFKNLKCHIILKELKEKNQGEKGIPFGEGFELVSCANYFWEVLAWICFSVFVNIIPFYVFTLFGFLIMKNWAQKKHRDYLKNFGEKYPKNRKAIIPFLI